MITAVDTSVLLDILTADPSHLTSSRASLLEAGREGALVICEIVLAELAAAFRGDVDALGHFLADAGIRLDRTPEVALAGAGRAWRDYRDAGGPRTRVVADFLVAAHATARADRLLTRDRGFYRSCFEGLAIIDPSTA